MGRIKKIKQSQLFKFSSLNAINVLVKIVAGIISAKILALFVGPSGIAFMGNFRNFMNSLENMVSLGFQNGIVKYVSDHKENPTKLSKVITTLFVTLFATCLVVGVLLFTFADTLSIYVFENKNDFSYLFCILPIILPFYLSATYITAIINGFGQSRKVLYINIIGNLVALIVTVLLVTQYQIKGALLALIISPSLLFLVTLFFLNTFFKIRRSLDLKLFDLRIIKDFLHYFLMASVSGVLGPVVMLAIRKHLILKTTLIDAGYWEAMQRISVYYFMFISVLVSVYYYPQLIAAKNDKETNTILWDYYKKVTPVFVCCMVLLYLLKDVFITFLYTPSFLAVGKLFLWQIIGDVLKSISLLLGMQFFARKMTKVFITTELMSLALSYTFSVFFINRFGLEGVVMAHAATYLVYLIVLGLYFRKILVVH